MYSSSAENFMRSAKAPTISAGVMIAKVIWKVANTDSGMVSVRLSRPTPAMKALPSPPMNEYRLTSPLTMPVVSKATE